MSEPQHPDILIRLMHFCASPDMFVREEISGGYVRDMLRDARDEIDRLRGYRDEAESDAAVARMLVDKLRLTDAEREAIEWCRDNITAMACPSSAFAYIHASSLRGLLARCAIGHQDGSGQATGQAIRKR